MKRTILCIAFALTGLNANVFGQTFTYNGINYEVTNTSPNEAKVGRHSGYLGVAVIPDLVENGGIWYSVTAIGLQAFENCMNLTSITFSNSVTTIGERAFQYCVGLTALTIGNSVTTIGEKAFGNCDRLRGALTIPNSVTTIGERAFNGCRELPSITLGNSLATIGDGAFDGCFVLASINVDANNPNYSSIDGILYNKVQDTLMLCPRGKSGALTIPNSVTTIGNNAFIDCSRLTGTLTIPNSVTTIGERAFVGCRFTAVIIGNSVTTIGERAFYGSGFTEITSLAVNPPILRDGVFLNVPRYTPIHVPCGSENTYKAANGWREFTDYTNCISGVGLTDVEAADFNIYPNPASDRINFSCSEAIKEIEVFNIVGQQIYFAKVNEKFTALNVAGFAKGNYIAKLYTAKGVVTKKFVVE